MSFRTPTNVNQTAAFGPAERTLLYRRKLHRLLELTETMAELTVAEAQRNAADRRPSPTEGPSAALDRMARCLRRTIMLDRILDDPVPARRGAPDGNHRNGVIDAIPQAPPQPSQDRPKDERPHRDWIDRERLDTPDFLIDLTKTTPAEVITEIEAELCLEGDIEDLATPQDLETAYARILKQCTPPPRRTPPGPEHQTPPVTPDDTG